VLEAAESQAVAAATTLLLEAESSSKRSSGWSARSMTLPLI